MKTATKLALLSTLYLSQGLPFGFFRQALPAMMRQRGVSLEDIGLASLLAAPWALKFLWSPLVDGLGWARVGVRRSWILPLQGLSIVTMAALAFVDTGDLRGWLWWVLSGVFVVNLLAATQDIATDGLAVTLLDHRERGLGNGVQVAGYRLGMILGGGFLLIVYERLGWTTVFLAMAAMLLVASTPVALYREPRRAPERARLGVDWSSLTALARRPGMALWFVVLAAYKTGEHMSTSVLSPFFVDLGLSLEDIGWITGTAGFVAGLLGAMAGGAMVSWLGRGRALLGFGVAQAISAAGYSLATLALPRATLIPALYGLCVVEHFVSGMATAALFTMMMDRARPDNAGADYTLQASVVVIATLVISALSGFVAAWLGYRLHFLVAGAVCLVALAPVLIYLRRSDAEAPS